MAEEHFPLRTQKIIDSKPMIVKGVYHMSTPTSSKLARVVIFRLELYGGGGRDVV